jgi:cell division protein FtsA
VKPEDYFKKVNEIACPGPQTTFTNLLMAPKPNLIVGLDIGTQSTKVVVAEVFPDSKVNVLGVGTSPSRGLRKGVVINIEATVEAISKAISQAETMAGCQISAVFASISGSHIAGFNSHGIVGVKSKEVSHLDVEKVIEAAKAVAIPLDREILHVLPQEFIIDEQDGIKDPIGISGVRLEARVHIVTGAVASAQNIVKCANRCGLTVRDIVLSSVAAGRAVLSPEEQELGVCLIDIGGGTTDLIVFHAGAVKHTSVISVGGNHITNDIAAGLRTPIAAAEEIKCRYGAASGNAAPIGAGSGATSYAATSYAATSYAGGESKNSPGMTGYGAGVPKNAGHHISSLSVSGQGVPGGEVGSGFSLSGSSSMIGGGSLGGANSSRDETIEVPSTGGRSSRVLSKLVLSEIVEPRINEILHLAQRELIKSGCYDLLTSGLVLTGGSASLSGLAPMAEQVFNLPVRLGYPTGVGGLTDLVKSPEYASAVGLVMYGMEHAGRLGSSSENSVMKRVARKVGNWFSDHF